MSAIEALLYDDWLANVRIRRYLAVGARTGEGPLTEPTTAVRRRHQHGYLDRR